MAGRFRERIKRSLADANLQSALDANAERRIAVRRKAFASMPDVELLRARAHAIKADVITNLDSYVVQFTNVLMEHGIQVHRAQDAEQAVRIVLEIARRTGVHLIAKSKTMVSEEIELNPALESAGLRVVETDLGEYIVQIRHEPPSHIITPAVHLRRADVGQTFHEVLGIPYTDDIPTMTNVARQTLREVFLNADMGISGVNFGVVESGTLCVVTNEGNGRMVTTLPPVHVALMGIERLVPTLDDLALMLALLPRSATGQKLSVYTNLIHAPRQENDPDGPRERHVILVDNGRSKIRQSPLEEILYCIRCGACLNACPVFREIGGHAYIGKNGEHSSYPGPVGSVLSPALFGICEFGQLARASSLCGACKEACPVNIDLPELLLRVRAGKVEQYSQDKGSPSGSISAPATKPNAPPILALGLRLYTWAAVSAWRFNAAQKMAGIFGHLGKWVIPSRSGQGSDWLHLPSLTGWGVSKDFPTPAPRTFHERWKEIRSEKVFSVNTRVSTVSEMTSSAITQELTGDNMVQMFADEVIALGALFTRCQHQDVVIKVLEVLAEQHAEQLLAWGEQYLPDGLLENLMQHGIEVIYPTTETKDGSSKVRVGLTGAIAGIAETGSLLLTGGAGQPLLASLLPEVHIALLHEKNLYPSLGDVITRQELRKSSAAVIISGPSRTADIEMTLTIGVHGPGTLQVILISDDAKQMVASS